MSDDKKKPEKDEKLIEKLNDFLKEKIEKGQKKSWPDKPLTEQEDRDVEKDKHRGRPTDQLGDEYD